MTVPIIERSAERRDNIVVRHVAERHLAVAVCTVTAETW